MPSSPPPDRFQREIDDIIRLAERRLEHQSFRYRMRRASVEFGNAIGRFNLRLPPAETLGGWGLALLLISWLLTLPIVNGVLLSPHPAAVGAHGRRAVADRGAGQLADTRRSGGRCPAAAAPMWRGERISYGSPYGESWLSRCGACSAAARARRRP